MTAKTGTATFDIGPEPPLVAPDLAGAAAFRETNVWPAEEMLPDWRQAMLAFSAACRAIALAVVASAARGLRLEPARLLAPCAGRNATLRLLHYPPIPTGFELRGKDGEGVECEVEGRRVIARPHVDTGLLSIIWQDGRGGLEVQGGDGAWRAVRACPAALSIHCGDLLAGPSDGALRATPHRVLSDGAERRSIGFFLEPDFTTQILPPDNAAAKSYAAHLIDEFPARFVAPPAGEAAPGATAS